MAPEVERVGTGIKVSWAEHGASLLFERLTEKSDGVVAEVTPIVNGYNSVEPLFLAPSKINLLSPRSRQEVFNRIKKYQHNIPWDDISEPSAHLALATFRRGEPATLLNATNYALKPSILAPMIYEGLPSTVYALAAKGKSLFALFVCLCIETGQSLCGFKVTQSRQTFYLDWELDQSVQGYRKQQIIRAHPNLETSGPLYRRMYRPLADEVQVIHRLVQEHEIGFIVVDSLAQATGGDQLGADGSLRFFEALRTIGVGALILAHAPKTAETKSIYGNVFNFNLSRNVWEIKSTQEENSKEVRVGFFHRKNNLGRLCNSFGLALDFPEEGEDLSQGIEFRSFDLSEDCELSQSLPLKKRILHALKRGPKTIKELSEELEAKTEQIKARLYEGSKKDFVKVCKSGSEWAWGLQEK